MTLFEFYKQYGWTRFQEAKDQNFTGCGVFNENAKYFCLLGACKKIGFSDPTIPNTFSELKEKVRAAIVREGHTRAKQRLVHSQYKP